MNALSELDHFNPDPALREWVLKLLDQAQKDAKTIDHNESVIKSANIKIQALTLELFHLKRMRYGVKNEALSAVQLNLFQETLDEDLSAIESEVEASVAPEQKKRRPRAGRQPLPEHLPRIEHRHEPESCNCGECGSQLTLIGEDVSEQLDVEPARFFVHRHIRPQYACRNCETVTAAAVPPAVIDGGMAAPGLLAWVAISKYVDHLPLYRLEQIAARQEVVLSRSTLAEWVGRTGVALQPLADRLVELLHKRPVIHADETPVAQLDPGKGKTKKAYLWAYRSCDLGTGPPIVVFDYQTGRGGNHVKTFLGEWKGSLMVDDYSAYKALFEGEIVELACWAHARRKFFDLHAANQSTMAAEALGRIAELYRIEQEGTDLTPDARFTLRQKKALPKLKALRDWLIAVRLTTPDNSGAARAIDYSLKRWEALERYTENGEWPIDNNPVENAIRPIAVGKKNCLFAGSERAGCRAAAIQSLLGTARLNGLDPLAWLKDTLEKLPTCPISKIDELLPFPKKENKENG